MHATLSTLFESLDRGLIWLDGAGAVRYANQKALQWTGWTTGTRPSALGAAVTRMLASRRPVNCRLAAANSLDERLLCEVIPGFSRDDALVLLDLETAAPADGGLENLMALIRADLAAPLDALTLGLSAASDRGETVTPAALLAQADALRTGFARLLDLAQVFGAEPLHPSERIELPPLLDRLWTAIEPIARARRLTLRIAEPPAGETLATVYGSAALLQRVFVECLESVLRNAPAGGTIDITLRQLGPRVLIMFRDSGLFAARRDNMHVLALERHREPSRLERVHDTIGLQLCQRIVKLHGGTLREEVDNDVRDVLIDLPTGSPAQAPSRDVGTDQVERYARDLARLLARRARSGAPPASSAIAVTALSSLTDPTCPDGE